MTSADRDETLGKPTTPPGSDGRGDRARKVTGGLSPREPAATGLSSPGLSSPGLSSPGVSLSGASVGRLSLYYRELHRMLDLQTDRINSRELGRLVDVSPAVVRRDLSDLGAVGRRGVGYDVLTLVQSIGAVLGSGMRWKVVLIGVGSIGHALLRYRGFQRLGFQLVAAFDSDPNKIGHSIADVPIHSAQRIKQDLGDLRPELAILTVPADHAAEIAATLVQCQVCGILNFAPITLKLPGTVAVVNVDLASELQRLAFAVHTAR